MPAGKAAATALASSISPQGITASQPAASACTITVVARSTSTTTATPPRGSRAGSGFGSRWTNTCTGRRRARPLSDQLSPFDSRQTVRCPIAQVAADCFYFRRHLKSAWDWTQTIMAYATRIPESIPDRVRRKPTCTFAFPTTRLPVPSAPLLPVVPQLEPSDQPPSGIQPSNTGHFLLRGAWMHEPKGRYLPLRVRGDSSATWCISPARFPRRR